MVGTQEEVLLLLLFSPIDLALLVGATALSCTVPYSITVPILLQCCGYFLWHEKFVDSNISEGYE